MIALLAAAAVITIAVLVKVGIIKQYTRGGGVLVMALTAGAFGLYGYQVIMSAMSLFCDALRMNEDLKKELGLSGSSSAGSIIRLVLLFIVLVPLIGAGIFVLYSMIKEPIQKGFMHTDMEYKAKCAERTAYLGIAAAIVMVIAGIGALLMTIPYWGQLFYTLVLINPLVLFVITLFTFGLALIVLPIYGLIANAALASIVTFGVGAVMTLYVFSAAMGIATAVRGYRAGKLAKGEATVCGLLSMLMFWNILPMIYMKKRVK